MDRKQPTLTSIPEMNENEEENTCTKWVPKKKHEVLKAKYKCLKKLFQIYDASVIGILPEPYTNNEYFEEQIQIKKRRKKRSHRTKTDACAGTTEGTSGDITQVSTGEETERESVATAVIRDLKLTKQSCTSTQIELDLCNDKDITTQGCQGTEGIVQKECEFTQTMETQPVPYILINEKPKPTRFQNFLNRIFGIREERAYKNYSQHNGHMYASSDNSFYHNYNYNHNDKRRRRGLRFRRIRRPKKIQSEGVLRDVKNPFILTYVQSVQRNCLMDTTPRQCPIVGCNMISYGIINYNDHLNLCHFPDRKHICHYCHEGFENEYEKFIHENEHIGITKLGNNLSTPSSARQAANKKASNTQTDPELTKCDVPEEKLKKIVSFFDKISDPDQYLTDIEKNRFSEMTLKPLKTEIVQNEGYISDTSDKKAVSCMNLDRKMRSINKFSSGDSEVTSKYPYSRHLSCNYCGEQFDYRRQLSLHMDMEHRVNEKFSKFHSCPGILNKRQSNHMDMVSEDGKINVQSIDRSHRSIRRINTPSTLSQESYTEMSRRKSDESLSCDYTSMDNVKKPSVVNNIVQKVRNGFSSYKWEPGTKIIRV